MTTHNLAEAEACTRIGVIEAGRLVAIGTLAELKRRAGTALDSPLEDVLVRLTGRGLRDGEASARDRILAFRKRGGELTR